MAVIRFEQISKEFTGSFEPAVFDVNLTVEEGSLVVFLGPSGCGKTTLLKMVNRLYEPTSGTIYLDGTDVRAMDVNTLRKQIGYVIQQVGLFPHMTVAENIAIVPELLGWPKDRIKERVDALLDLIKLPPEEYCQRYPSQLSGGQQQRVGVARGLAGDPEVILMDEPFGAIDAITRARLQDELLHLQRMLKKTILFVTHDVDEALYLADKIAVMQKGRIIQYDTPFNIVARPANDFVYELVGADDMVRQLSLVRVQSAMEEIPPGFQVDSQPEISMSDNLRRALSLLLQTGTSELIVIDKGEPVGILTLEKIRSRASKERRS